MVLVADHPSKALFATRFDTEPFQTVQSDSDAVRHQRPILVLHHHSQIRTVYLLMLSLTWAALPWLVLALLT